MPEALASACAAALPGATIGFCGKLPVRGDFVAFGLPRRFVEPWHDWWQRMLPAGRQALGDEWEPAWNEAPIWRFALSPGISGPEAVLGLWMPSVDTVGRHFPLTFAVLAAGADMTALLRECGRFLDVAEAAGLAALAADCGPDVIAARLPAEAGGEPLPADLAPEHWRNDGAVWWTRGAPRVPAGIVHTGTLPDAATFSVMLQAGRGQPARNDIERAEP